MAKKQEKDSKSELEERVWNAIAAFEQILEAMPNDRESLDALAHAYEQIGDHSKAKDHLVRLGNVIIQEGDTAAAQEILEKVEIYAEHDDNAKQLFVRLKDFLSIEKTSTLSAKGGTQARQAKSGTSDVRSSFNMADELSVAWNILEAGELTQEEYSSVVQDLTEMSASESNTTISVLHVLEARAFKSLEKIIGYISRECTTPVITLASFDLQPSVVSLLPMDFIVRRGAMVFELIGNNALVVVMNPYNTQLRQDIQAAIGKKCHFFMALSSDFDHAINRVNQASTEKK